MALLNNSDPASERGGQSYDRRSILRKIASSEYDGLGDVSTLADPEIVDTLIDEHWRRDAK